MVFFSFLCFILLFSVGSLLNKGLPDCLSDIYYSVGLFFTAMMLFVAFFLLPSMIDATPENYQCLAFLANAGIVFVGAAPNYKEGMERNVHRTAAMISGGCSVVWTAIVSPWHCMYLLIALVGIVDRRRWLLWFELPCFAMIYAVLM